MPTEQATAAEGPTKCYLVGSLEEVSDGSPAQASGVCSLLVPGTWALPSATQVGATQISNSWGCLWPQDRDPAGEFQERWGGVTTPQLLPPPGRQDR